MNLKEVILKASKVVGIKVDTEPDEEMTNAIMVSLPGLMETTRIIVVPCKFKQVEEGLHPDDDLITEVDGYSVYRQEMGSERGLHVEVDHKIVFAKCTLLKMLHSVFSEIGKIDLEYRLMDLYPAFPKEGVYDGP